MKKVLSIFLFSILIISTLTFKASANTSNYGVFIGASPKDMNKLLKYKEIVIDASGFSKQDIDCLHKNNVKVYSYLNIGSIESFRPYYNQFEKYTLGNYENWNDEKWIDVSNSHWRQYIRNTLAKNLLNKGVDGFFIDNVDVYSNYKTEAIYTGVMNILKDLNKTGKPLIVNGGYDFFTTALSKGVNINKLVYGVNSENVFTDVDFSTGKFISKNQTDVNYAIEYLNILKKKGINIYIIEYSKNTKLNLKIQSYYNKVGFKYYIATSLALK